MAIKGPVILVEDDVEDAELIAGAIREIGVPNEVKICHTAAEAHEYLLNTTDKPMVILCDIRMSNLDGLSFRRKINENPYLRKKSIPFVFLSAMVSEAIVDQAYDLDIQGFFDKPQSYQEFKDHLLSILVYWQRAHYPTALTGTRPESSGTK